MNNDSTWKQLCMNYTKDEVFIEECFQRIIKAYSESQRHYHTLEHILSIIEEVTNVNNSLMNKSVLLFATYFHDIVYNPRKHDNEYRSAEVAVEILRHMTVPERFINEVKAIILATANHTKATSSHNLDFFLDCDLKILGSDPERYKQYAKSIRKEYKHVPSLLYRPGRKKVLTQFLESPSIYRTPHFQTLYEEQARINILNEMKNEL